ncbi:MAG: hypothetical protein WA440_06025 [Ignavibacteriaceae bacterium]
MKTLLVPEQDIKNVEREREHIHEYLSFLEKKMPDGKLPNGYPVLITQNIWHLTHRRYKESLLSKIKRWLAKKSK